MHVAQKPKPDILQPGAKVQTLCRDFLAILMNKNAYTFRQKHPVCIYTVMDAN